VHDSAQLQQLVALGRAVAVLPDPVRGGLPGGIVAVPLVDAPRVTTLLAWPPRSRSRALAHLVRAASRL
jgi:DNA-binding transcriptional LysR family regulator